MAEGASRISQEEIDEKNRRLAAGTWNKRDEWLSDEEGDSWKKRTMGFIDPMGLIFPYHDKEDVMSTIDPSTGLNVYDWRVDQAMKGYGERGSPADIRAKANLSRAIMASRARGTRGGGPLSQAAALSRLAPQQRRTIGKAGRVMGRETARQEGVLAGIYGVDREAALQRAMAESARTQAIQQRNAALAAQYDTQGARYTANLIANIGAIIGSRPQGGQGIGDTTTGAQTYDRGASGGGGGIPAGYGSDTSTPGGMDF